MKKNLTKIALIAMSVVILGLSIAVGTLAYLQAKTESITNTFTVGANVSITLTETTGGDYKIMPGQKAAKDPVLAVGANSEDCWVFVAVDESADVDTYVTYAMADGWTQVAATNDGLRTVYGRSAAQTKNASLQILAGEGDGALAKGVVTYKNVDAVTGTVTLTFTGYAIQAAGFGTMADAYTELQKTGSFNLPALPAQQG